jgi:hypothetical protein
LECSSTVHANAARPVVSSGTPWIVGHRMRALTGVGSGSSAGSAASVRSGRQSTSRRPSSPTTW